MGFLDRFKKKPLDAVVVTGKQPENFYMAVLKYKDRPGYSVRYSQKKQPGELAKHIDDIPISDTLEVAKNIEDFIGSKWGGGHWQLQILDGKNKFVCTYQLAIGGTPYNNKTGRKASPDDPDPDTSSRRRSNPNDELVARMMEKTLTQDPLAMLTQIGAVIAQFSGGSSKMEDLAEQMLVTKFNNDVSSSEGDIDRVKGIIEIGRMFAPAVPAEDALTSVIQTVPALLSAFAAMKGGAPAPAAVSTVQQAPALSQGNGGIDFDALRSLAGMIPQEMIAQLPADQQAAIQQLRNTAPPGVQVGEALPRPGGSIVPDSGDISAATAPEVIPPSTGQKPVYGAIDAMIEEIRVGLRGTASDNEVARKMLAMITAARGFTSSEPHPVLKGVMEATEKTGAAEFKRFCQAIPELGRDYERIERIEQEIVGVMRAGAAETQSALESDEVEDGLNFAYETETEEMAATTEQSDVSGSPRIQETGTEATRAEQDRGVDEESRPSAEYHAKAV